MSASATLAAPTLTAPIDGAVVPLDAVTFRWTAPPGSASFDLRIALASDASTPFLDLSGLAATEFTLADALPTGDAVWWVRQSGEAWSRPASFRAGTPADVEIAQRAAAEAADADRARRRDERRDGAASLWEAPPDPVWPYAHGDALDGAPALDWSTVPGFGTPTARERPVSEADAPTPLGPLGGEIVDAAIVSLRWTAVPGADGYQIELSPHTTFDCDVLTIDAGAATEMALPGVVPAVGRKLLWRVRALVGDAATPWSKYGRFYPAGGPHVDQFRADLDVARLAQRKQREHAARLRQHEIDLVPLHQRPDAVTSTAMAAVVVAMALSGVGIGLLALVFAVMTGG